ncbi:hypothetical protein HBI56_007700 [Parastagonospora nodorum]|uniref:Uncharacterized protein n=1 Tax=Phaeosphaeria nodorum (strain SN15 / ATCC MYA-4574 / FGSC 10173) TaxID=321614 RepID=A0A7U2ETX8_PHANO|nr:hypothetical protein HBH56_122020 [Parastagonospora nodorum]QRC91024.1 hypothetical protein JI435_300300 [Parastagonospora nodorum SN15]KAH3934992.1 hypothetical protein HBH54_047570 [Parastagonospora nodorum]KAH3950176.1 hypothetical protein HBH53_076400 [Parastagonospora nodorum]KAH3987195.1 hypothetical protein HBH51_009490 [Parastagonospora nodorum]
MQLGTPWLVSPTRRLDLPWPETRKWPLARMIAETQSSSELRSSEDVCFIQMVSVSESIEGRRPGTSSPNGPAITFAIDLLAFLVLPGQHIPHLGCASSPDRSTRLRPLFQ